MNTENEKRLDDLFKKKLEDPVDEIRYEEGDWDALEQLLDKPKRKGIAYLWPILSGVAALMLVFLGWWALRPKNGGQQNGNPVKIAAHHGKDTIIDNKSVAGTKKTDTIINKQAIASPAVKDTTINKSQVIAGKNVPLVAPGKVQAIVVKKAQDIKNYRQNQPAEPVIKTGKQQFAVTPLNNKTDTIINKTNKDNKVSSDALAANQVPVTNPSPKVNQPGVTQPVVSQPQNNAKDGVAAATPVKPRAKPQRAYRPQYTLSVVAAPDLNGVNSFSQGKVGTNIGLTFSMGLSRKLTVTTGALYSVKPYLTSFSNYNTGSGYQFASNPQSVTADCRMLDIPLNIGYQLYHKRQNKISVGTGLSSYIMLHESYKFTYEQQQQQQYQYGNGSVTGPATYTVANPGKYFFGVMNLNATYERQLNSKIGVSIQPYLKIPLSNVGYSQVKLQTTGVAVGLSWNLNSLTKP